MKPENKHGLGSLLAAVVASLAIGSGAMGPGFALMAQDTPYAIPKSDFAVPKSGGVVVAASGGGALADITDIETDCIAFLTDTTSTSANLRTCVTDETGAGSLVFGTAPTFDLMSVGNGASGAGYINFVEDTDNGSNLIRIIGQSTLGANRIFTLPDTADDTFTLNAATQTLSAKTLTAPNVGNAATSGGYARFLEDTDNGANYIQLTGQNTLAGDYTYTIPNLVGNGTVAVSPTNYPGLGRNKTEFMVWEDFECRGAFAAGSTLAPCGKMWGINASGSTAAGFLSNTITADGTAPGVAFFSTGTTVNGVYSLNMFNVTSTDADSFSIDGGEIFETRFYVPNLPGDGDSGNDDFGVRLGWCDTFTSLGCSNGVNVIVDETNSKFYQCFAKSDGGGAATQTASDLAITAAWHTLRIEINSTGDSAAFIIDGTPLSCSPIAVAADIPNGPTEGTGVQLKIGGSNTALGCSAATDCTVGIDYVYVYDPSVAR